MKPQSAIKKGKRFEEWVCQQIEQAGLGFARRETGSGSGKRKGDIFTSIDLLFECKNQARLDLWRAIYQAQQQAAIGYHNPAKWCLVVADPHSPQANPDAVAILDFQMLLKLLVDAKEPKSKAPDKELKWKLERLKSAINSVAKEL